MNAKKRLDWVQRFERVVGQVDTALSQTCHAGRRFSEKATRDFDIGHDRHRAILVSQIDEAIHALERLYVSVEALRRNCDAQFRQVRGTPGSYMLLTLF